MTVDAPGDIEVRKNEARSRYELFIDGAFLGFAEYRDTGDAVVFPHTVIDAEHRGNGFGALLVRGALDDAREQGRTVIARCWYVADFIDENSEYKDLLGS
jgi:hypothetical protein